MTLIFLLALLGQETNPQGFRWPVEGNITSGYGPRWGTTHRGVDISAVEGTWVRAAAGGKVVWAGEYGKYGNLVTVRHSNGFRTFYAHLQNFCVFKYQRVEKGQRLGRVGITGKTTGPHLHFEIHLAKQAQDPLSLLPPIFTTPAQGEVATGGP